MLMIFLVCLGLLIGDVMSGLGKHLKFYRLRKGLTQRELSEISCVSLRLIQHYEQDSRDLAKAQLRTVCSLAVALDVTVEQLLCL